MQLNTHKAVLNYALPQIGAGRVFAFHDKIIVETIYIRDTNMYVPFMSYPSKLRELALQALRNGHTKVEVSKMLDLGINTLKSWEKLEAETGSLENRPLHRTAYRIDRSRLLEYCRQNPFCANKETAAAFGCSASGIRSAKQALKITRKKHNSIREAQRAGGFHSPHRVPAIRQRAVLH